MDRELLEMAAKASGLSVQGAAPYGLSIRSDASASGYDWNPLTDDGDALRLAAKLGLGVIFATGEVYVGLLGEGDQTEIIEDESEPYASTRRAIVRAAAEIGRAM